ncbi:hypothetical protein QE152_g15481 [Popillia japonica]|uniref:Uncharacterized protein n=1 Tax=Popillia japonica TaxID=7064 RepID=A0AAW1L8U4_POPJA
MCDNAPGTSSGSFSKPRWRRTRLTSVELVAAAEEALEEDPFAASDEDEYVPEIESEESDAEIVPVIEQEEGTLFR